MASEPPPILPLHATPSKWPAGDTALVFGEERWSWADLDRRSAQWAAHLVAACVSPDDFVAFALPNGPELIALTFGIYRVGATPAPLSPKLVTRELDEILALLDPAAFIGPPSEAAVIRLDPPSDGRPAFYPEPAIAAAWKACTSGGSTGRPKLIVDGSPAGFPAGTEFIGIPTGGRVLVPGPLYHNATFSAAIFALWRGSTLVMMERFDAAEAVAQIEAERVEWSLMVPTMMHRILQLPQTLLDRHDLKAWAMVVHTASAIAETTKRAWIARFGADHVWEVYGATEGLFRTWIGGADWLAHPGSVGRTAKGFHLSIRDPDGREVPDGTIGEIFAIPPGGPGSSYRYIGADRRLTENGWESVGDIGHLDEEGYLYLADRRSDLIISGGVNIWPAEVEGAILDHPSIRSTAVFALPDEDLGQRVHAVIETDDEALDLPALHSFLKSRLASQKLPKSMTRTQDAVRDDAGKVRKSAWQAQLKEDEHAR